MVAGLNVYEPDPAQHEAYEKNYSVFRNLYRANRKFFKILNS